MDTIYGIFLAAPELMSEPLFNRFVFLAFLFEDEGSLQMLIIADTSGKHSLHIAHRCVDSITIKASDVPVISAYY